MSEPRAHEREDYRERGTVPVEPGKDGAEIRRNPRSS